MGKKSWTYHLHGRAATVLDRADATPHISIVRQCELLELSRSSYYYEPCSESAENLALMRLIDEQYLETPFYGSRRMTAYLQSERTSG